MGVSQVCLVLLVVGLSLCSPAFSYSHRLVKRQNVAVCDPTPVNLRQSFETNCTEAPVSLDNATCDRAWMTFNRAFARRDPTTVMASDYDGYFEVLPIEVPERSQNLFWSGVLELVEMVSCMCSSEANVVSSANTPSSAIFNGIRTVYWCGTTDRSSTDGIDTTNQCPCSVTAAFWARFSVKFAQSAQGTAFFLGYGEKKNGAFNNMSSFFSQHELPNLSPPRVTEVVVMVVTNGTGESCGKGTLVTLQERILARNLKFSCYDIFGNPTVTSQVEALSTCASKIITAVQNGSLPASDDCFAMRAGAGVTMPQILALIGSLVFVAAILLVINQ